MANSTTQYKGDCGKAKAISTLTELGFKIGMLLTESAHYDLLVDVGDDVKRVSVKYLGSKTGGLDLRHIHSNSGGYVVRKPEENDYDWLYIYKNDGKEYLYKECLHSRSFITPKEENLVENIFGELKRTGSQHS